MRKCVLLIAALSANLISTPSQVLAAGDPCILKPKQAASGHWYYHVDPVTHQKCWFVAQPGTQIQHPGPPRPISPTTKHKTSSAKALDPIAPEENRQDADDEKQQNSPQDEKPKNSLPEQSNREALFREFLLWEMLHAER